MTATAGHIATPPRCLLALVAVVITAITTVGCSDDNPTNAGTDPTSSTVVDRSSSTTADLTTSTTTGSSTTETTQPASTTAPDGMALSIAEALEVNDDDLHQITGYAITVHQIPRLCSALAESDPPQCGEPSITLAGDATSNLDALFPNQLTTRDGVAWTSAPVTVTGAVINTASSGTELWITN